MVLGAKSESLSNSLQQEQQQQQRHQGFSPPQSSNLLQSQEHVFDPELVRQQILSDAAMVRQLQTVTLLLFSFIIRLLE